jgi:hypothetical protein
MSSKREYEMVAGILAKIKEGSIKNQLIDEFVKAFKEDNPVFNKVIFVRACSGLKTNRIASAIGRNTIRWKNP